MQLVRRLTFILLVALITRPASADAPVVVTTDTAEFCALLASKIDQDTDASFDVIALAAQGKSLCAHGNIRAGIARLRRALLAVRDEDGYDITITVVPAPTPPTVVGNDNSGNDNGFFSARQPHAPNAPAP